MIASLLFVFFVSAFISCGNKENNTSSDEECEEMYDDSPVVPDWSFQILVTEDKPIGGEEEYLHTGGFEYKGFTIITPGGYAAYSNTVDYQNLVTLFYMVDHLAHEYSKSGDTYPSKEEWAKFQTDILGPLREGVGNWETIPVKSWRKKAGDYYYELENRNIMIGRRSTDMQSYFYEGYSSYKQYLVISAAKENNEFKIPEDALIIETTLGL